MITGEQTIVERDGSTRFYTKGTTDGWTIAASCYESMLADWMAGKAFYRGVDVYGDVVTIKLAEVVSIYRNTPEGIERWQEDESILKRRKMMEGEG